MASRWDRDRKVDGSGGRDRDQDSRNGRGGGSGRTFESSHQRSKSPPREKRMIKLGGSSNTSASTSNNGQARAENNRSRSRSRDRSNGNGNSNDIRGEDRRRSESPKREGGIQKPSSSPVNAESNTLNRMESGEIVEDVDDTKKDSPTVDDVASSPPLGKKKDRWADSDDEDESSGEDEASKSDGGQTKGPAQNGESGTSPSIAMSPARGENSLSLVEGGTDNEIDMEVQEQKPVIIEHNPLLQGCRDVDIYQRLNRIAEGTYGVVFRAREKTTGKIKALKQVKMSRQELAAGGFPITAVREINIMLCLKHENIVEVQEMVIQKGQNKGDSLRVFMVMEYFEYDLKKVMDKMKTKWTQSEAKCLLKQLLNAIHFMHEKWYIHRDLKTSNLLYNNQGKLCVCDFGMARKYGDPIRDYSTPVVTLYYRSPELLLGARKYSTAVDMWSVGCIFAEILLKKPLFIGKNELTQLEKIFSVLGNPTEERWPKYTELPDAAKFKWKLVRPCLRSMFPTSAFAGDACLSANGVDLLERMLCLNPDKRISAGEALKHEYFQERPAPKDMSLMPTYAEDET